MSVLKREVFDCETDGLLDELTRIHCLVLKNPDTGDMLSCTPDRIEEGLKRLMEADEIIGHNIIKFDIPALQKVYPWFKPKARILDTLTIARLIWPVEELRERDLKRVAKKNSTYPKNLIGAYALEAFGHRFGLQKGDYSKEMKSKGLDPWANWNQEMQDYCDLDVEVTCKLWERIEEEKWSQISIDLEIAVQQIIYRQERYGFLFDVAAGAALYAQLVQVKVDMERQLQEVFKPWYRPAGVFTPSRPNKTRGYMAGCSFTKVKLKSFNASSRLDIADRLIKLKGWTPKEFTPEGRPAIDEKILSTLKYPEAKLLSRYLMVEKRIGQLAEGTQSWLSAAKKSGRIHGRVTTNGAVTGRMTHQSPNIAQTPACTAPYGHECRMLFIVPKGKKLIGCDASSLELCNLAGYMAYYDNGKYIDVVMRGDKANGTDIHSVNARALGLEPKGIYKIRGKDLTGRDIAKTWFYAFIYGAGDQKLGLILGETKARPAMVKGKHSRATFLKNLPALKKLVEKVKEAAEKKGHLIGLDGRRLHVRSAHSALNTLLQSAGALIMKKALVILDNDLQQLGLIPSVDYEFVANIHDEFQIEATEKYAEVIGKAAKDAIRKAGEAFNFRCPIDGEYKVGNNWADTH